MTFSSSDLGQNWADARIRFPLDLNQASLLSQDADRLKKRVGLGSNWSEGRVLFKDYCDYCFCHESDSSVPASCYLFTGSVWSKTVWWCTQRGEERGSPWFSGTKHNNICKPRSCGTLFLQGPPLSHTPDNPFPPVPAHPFLEAWAHTTLSRIRGITLGVHLYASVRIRFCSAPTCQRVSWTSQKENDTHSDTFLFTRAI